MAKFYITTPIYYVNAKPHIGHAYTTVAADVIARYHRLLGDDVFFLTGSDEHGSKIAKAAQAQNKKPQKFCDEITAYFKSLWDALSISYDDFIRTTEARHKDGVLKFIEKLKEANAIYESEYEGFYCEGCEKFMTEKEMVDGKCPYHQKAPEKISEKNYFFRLSKYLPEIKSRIESDKIKILPENEKKEVLGLFKQGLSDFSISREKVKWGIKFPYGKDQITYVWVDALSNYITALGYPKGKNFQKFWPADLHLIGRDILKFHAIYWPAMLRACGEKLPRTLFVHGFFTVSGQKMSKSLGNVIDPNEMIKKYGSDGARYLIISQFPFGQDGDIKAERFDEKYNAELANNLGNLVARVTTLARNLKFLQKGESSTKSGQILKLKAKSRISNLIVRNWKKYIKSLNNFQIDEGLDAVYEIINYINKYIDDIKPWELQKNNQKKFEIAMFDLLEVLRHIGWMLNPYLPETSKKILEQLGIWEREKTRGFEEIKKWKTEIDISKIKKGKILFPRI